MAGLIDLEELVLKCNSEGSKKYIGEAVSSYKAAAFRASIVMTWIAVVFDIIDKMRELKIAGDAQAVTYIAQFEMYQAQIEAGNAQGIVKALEFERNILDYATNLLLIDAQEKKDLENLRSDRHMCAHPSFQKIEIPFMPSAEQARLHMRNAVTYLLQEKAVQGRYAIETIKKTIGSQFFPKDIDEAQTVLTGTPLGYASPTLVKALIDELLYGYFDPAHEFYKSVKASTTLEIAHRLYPVTVEDRLRGRVPKVQSKVPDDLMAFSVALACRRECIWQATGDAEIVRFNTYIDTADADDVVRVINLTIKRTPLMEATKRFIARSTKETLAKAVSYYKALHPDFIRRGLDLYLRSGSWDVSNHIANSILIPMTAQLDGPKIREIVEGPRVRGADIIGSNSYPLLLWNIVDRGTMPLTELVAILEAENQQAVARQLELDVAAGEIPF